MRVLFPFVILSGLCIYINRIFYITLESLIEFHQTLHTHAFLYDKYLLQKRKG